jgi:glycosyltransferase involved in cell wall biosynthesis
MTEMTSTGTPASETQASQLPTLRPFRVAYFLNHPIQYQSPMLRRIASAPWIDLTVYYFSDFTAHAYKDSGFGVSVAWDVPLLDGYKSEYLPYSGQQTTPMPQRPRSRGIFKRLHDGKFDAVWVHGYSYRNAMHVMLAAKLLGIPVLLRAEPWLGDRPRSKKTVAAKNLFFAALKRFVTAVLPIGTLNDEYWQHYFGGSIPRFLFPYCVDNQFFQQRSVEAAARRSELQSALGLDPTRPVILFASKLQARKHCGDLLEAYIKMRDTVPVRPYLLIIGDGEQRSELESRLRELRETGAGDVRMLGFRNQTELPRYFDLCDVFVLPSRHEPWGLVVNEAMNAGRAIIVTSEVGSARDLVRDGVNGFIVPVRDVDALAEALRKVTASKQTAAAMGAESLKTINRWSFEEDVTGLKNALQFVCRR